MSVAGDRFLAARQSLDRYLTEHRQSIEQYHVEMRLTIGSESDTEDKLKFKAKMAFESRSRWGHIIIPMHALVQEYEDAYAAVRETGQTINGERRKDPQMQRLMDLDHPDNPWVTTEGANPDGEVS